MAPSDAGERQLVSRRSRVGLLPCVAAPAQCSAMVGHRVYVIGKSARSIAWIRAQATASAALRPLSRAQR